MSGTKQNNCLDVVWKTIFLTFIRELKEAVRKSNNLMCLVEKRKSYNTVALATLSEIQTNQLYNSWLNRGLLN